MPKKIQTKDFFEKAIKQGFGEKVLYYKENIIYAKGQMYNKIYYIDSGRVKFSIISRDGKEKTLSFFGAGNIFGEVGFFSGKPFVFNAVAVEKTEIFLFEPKDVLQQINGAEILLREISQKLHLVHIHLEIEAFGCVETKIAKILLTLMTNEYEINITQEELSALVNISRVTVNKVLNDFSKKNLILKKRNRIIINKELIKEKYEDFEFFT